MPVTRSARTGVKAAVAAAGAVALLSTGVAFAATGHSPLAGLSGASTQAADPSHPAHPTHPTRPAHPTHPAGGPSDDSSHATGPGTHAFKGLCTAYAAGNKAEHGKAWASPAFTALVTAAGGTDNVATFCATVSDPASTEAADDEATDPADVAPTHPAHPVKPTHPTHPAKPTHPTHPVKPTQPTHPTHPTHPTKPTKPEPTE
jgi:hypothetical protein